MASDAPSQRMTKPLQNDEHVLRALFDDYVFYIPKYQRFYSWNKSQWDDLWNDLLNIIDDPDRDHYMGTVICKDEKTPRNTEGYGANYREYGIVDGQQRFTTLVLLIKAIIANLDSIDINQLSSEARQIYEQIPNEECRSQFVADQNLKPTNEGYEEKNKLKLQKDDNDIFKDILRDDVDKNTLSTPSEERLVDAYEFYESQLETLWQELSPTKFLDLIGRLLSCIQSLEFMAYIVQDRAKATLIFESINDRGKGLSNLDKSKSFLMHKIYLTRSGDDPSEVSIDLVQSRFERIYENLQTLSINERTSGIGEDRIQRYHYVSTIDRTVNRRFISSETDRRNRNLPSGGTVYLDALKWHFGNLHKGDDSGPYEEYPRHCIEEIDWYTDSLNRYYSHMETIATYGKDGDYNADIDWELRKLYALDRLGNFYPLLLTIWDKYHTGRLSGSELYEILQTIEVAAFRIYPTVTRSDTGQPDFYKLANKTANSSVNAKWVIEKIKDHIRSHENDFEGLLRDSNAYHRIRKKDIRYLLYSYDLKLRKEGKGGAGSSIQKAAENVGNDYTIDHIWADDESKLNLAKESVEIHENVKHKLGNLTLTTGPRNSGWKNLPYEKKRERIEDEESDYMNSDFPMTRKIAREYDTWGESQITERTDELVEFANRRWSLDANEREPLASIRPSEAE